MPGLCSQNFKTGHSCASQCLPCGTVTTASPNLQVWWKMKIPFTAFESKKLVACFKPTHDLKNNVKWWGGSDKCIAPSRNTSQVCVVVFIGFNAVAGNNFLNFWHSKASHVQPFIFLIPIKLHLNHRDSLLTFPQWFLSFIGTVCHSFHITSHHLSCWCNITFTVYHRKLSYSVWSSCGA